MHFCKNDVVSNKLFILKKIRFQRHERPKRMETLSELRSKSDYGYLKFLSDVIL